MVIGELLFISGLFWQHYRSHLPGRLGIIFSLSASFWIASIVVITYPELTSFMATNAVRRTAYMILFYTYGYFLWVFALSVIDDQFRFGKLHIVLLSILVLLNTLPSLAPAFAVPTWPLLMYHACQLLLAAMYIHLWYVAFIQLGDELIESRRYFRTIFVGPASIAGFIHEPGMVFGGSVAAVYGLHIGIVLLTAFSVTTLALWLFGPSHGQGLFDRGRSDAKAMEETTQSPDRVEADKILTDRLLELMNIEKAYRQPGLTITELAAKMHVPAHQLRKLINSHMGHRNFSSFLNRYRIAEACEILGNSDSANSQVLGIAFSLGYQSLSPFNRAFKESTGLTPSDYRRQSVG